MSHELTRRQAGALCIALLLFNGSAMINTAAQALCVFHQQHCRHRQAVVPAGIAATMQCTAWHAIVCIMLLCLLTRPPRVESNTSPVSSTTPAAACMSLCQSVLSHC